MKKDEKQLILSAAKRQVKRVVREFLNDYPELIRVTKITQEDYEKLTQQFYPYLDRYLGRVVDRVVDYEVENGDDLKNEVFEVMLKELLHVIVDMVPAETYLSLIKGTTVAFEGDRVMVTIE